VMRFSILLLPSRGKHIPLAGYLFILVGSFLALRLGKFE